MAKQPKSSQEKFAVQQCALSCWWGTCAIKAEGVCRLVLPGVPTCAPLKQEGSKNFEMWAACWDTSRPKNYYFYCVRVGQCCRYLQMLLLPLGIPPIPLPACSTQNWSHSELWRVLATTNMGNVTQGHHVLPISDAQHAQAFCHLFQRFTVLAPSVGVFRPPRPCCGAHAGPRQCCVVGVHPTKALLWGLGNALQWVCIPQKPCCGA